jgi:hypothetical protein
MAAWVVGPGGLTAVGLVGAGGLAAGGIVPAGGPGLVALYPGCPRRWPERDQLLGRAEPLPRQPDDVFRLRRGGAISTSLSFLIFQFAAYRQGCRDAAPPR